MSKRSFAILILLLLAARACLVLSLSDVFFFGEEMAKGTAAKAMIDGLGVPHFMLNYGYHEGGGFVVTHLKAVAFLLAGENLVAQKLVALLTASTLLAVGWWFASEHFGGVAGWIFGLLYIFGPAAFQRLSLVTVGTHFEATIFVVLILHFAFRIAFAENRSRETSAAVSNKSAGATAFVEGRPRQGASSFETKGSIAGASSMPSSGTSTTSIAARRRFFDHVGLGLSAGFGLYFSLQSVPATACAALTLIAVERKRVFSRATAIALAAFAVGAAPLWYMMSQVGMAALVVRAQGLGQGASLADGVRVLFEPLSLHGSAIDWIVLALFPLAIALGLGALWRAAHHDGSASSHELRSNAPLASPRSALDPEIANRKAMILLGYCALFLFLYLTSGYAAGLYGHWFILLRISPLWVVGILIIAAASRPLSTNAFPTMCRIYAGVVAVLLLSGAIDFVRVVAEGRPSEIASNARLLATTKGYNFSEYLDKFVHHFEASEDAKIAVLRRFQDEPELLLPSINHSLFEKSTLPLEDVLAISRRAYGDLWLESLKGLGPYLRASNGYDLAAEFAVIARAPADTQVALAEGAGRTGLGLKIWPERIEEEIRSPIPAQWRAAFLRGTGWRIHQINRLWPERARAFIAHESPADQAPLREGFEAALAANTLKH
jgi:hypothetical protein